MSKWATFYYDVLRDRVFDLRKHDNREDALKYFNANCTKYFQLGTKYKADKLPATYGYPLRKYVGMSSIAFKRQFGVSIDEALKMAEVEG